MLDYILNYAKTSIIGKDQKEVVRILIKGLSSQDLDCLKSANKEPWLDELINKQIKLRKEKVYTDMPIGKLVRLYENPKSGKRSVARKVLHRRFGYLSIKEKLAIINASLKGARVDYEWAYIRLLSYWDDKFLPRIVELWEKYHDDLAGLLVIQHAPKNYVRNNSDKFPPKYIFALSIRLKDDETFVVNKDCVSLEKFIEIMSTIERTVDYETARDYLYVTFLKNIDSCIDGFNNVWADRTEYEVVPFLESFPMKRVMHQLSKIGRQDLMIEFLEIYQRVTSDVEDLTEELHGMKSKSIIIDLFYLLFLISIEKNGCKESRNMNQNNISSKYSPNRYLGWDAEQWKEDFEKAKSTRDYHLLRDLRVDVFNDTVAHVMNSGYTLMPDIAVFIDENEGKTVLETKVYDKEIAQTFSDTKTETKVDVINGDTLVVAKSLLDEGLRPAVLNMASRQVPGGGVAHGAGAQEENLFRRTNLYLSMFQYHTPLAKEYGLFRHLPQAYPLDRNWGGIYTPKACVFRGTEAEGYPLLREPYYLDFVSVPAVNRPELDERGMIVPHLVEVTKRKIRTIFRIAIENGNDSLVLGAFGCGAFCNPPAHMARIFHEVIDEKEFSNCFTRITFAILDDHNAGRKHNPEGNFLPFAREFRINPS